MAEFDINSIFEKVFGRRGRRYDNSKLLEKQTLIGEYDGLQTRAKIDQEGDAFVAIRKTIKARTPLGQLVFMPVRIGGVLLPNEPTMRISGGKTIAETTMVGAQSRGTVKELINFKDYRILIRGVMLNYNSQVVFPEDQFKSIHDLCQVGASLEIESALTSMIGVYRIVIEDFDFPEMIGVQHAQAYEIRCKSDRDFILTVD